MGIFEELGVRKVINCMGPFTIVGGSLMPQEVVNAMAEAAASFVSVNELLEKAGKKIADLTGTPAAFITSGAAAGLAVATAACMAGTDPLKAKQLPDTSGMKNEIIVLRRHRIHYDQAIRVAGARFVEIGFCDWSEPEALKAAITPNTAAIFYVAKYESAGGSIPLVKVIEIAKKNGLPVIVDAADELPPLSNLRKYNDLGADLVVFSGGKGICGPQSAGLILGDKELIEACAVNGSPNYGIGRPMKVSKEDIVGLTKAVELFVKKDFEAEMHSWENQRDYIIERLSKLPNVKCLAEKPIAPGAPGSFYLPTVFIDFIGEKVPHSIEEVVETLWEGDPRIVVGQSRAGIIIRVMMLKAGEERLVAERLLEILA